MIEKKFDKKYDIVKKFKKKLQEGKTLQSL